MSALPPPDEEQPLSPFDRIRHETPDGGEYWSARELAQLLGYTEYGKFRNTLTKAELACTNSGQSIDNHFAHMSEMVSIGSGARRKVADIHLSRYACYLVVQNADPEKENVALGQTYFAVQTNRAEQMDELAGLSERQKRLYLRNQLAGHNRELAATARGAGVLTPQDFAVFQDHGYMGLYGGERARDIHRRKELRPGQEILDYMGNEELAANLFRSTQAEAKIRREQIHGKAEANQAHEEMGAAVRGFIIAQGGTPPEQLPPPVESIQQAEQAERKRLKRGPQLSMFGDEES